MEFTRAPPPTPEQLQRLLERVATRSPALTGGGEEAPEPEVQAPLLKVFGAELTEPAAPRLVAQVDGFNLHAATHFEAHERVALERFCRYALRGVLLAQARLTSRLDGKLVYRLKVPRPDGTTHVVFTPQALLQRLRWILPLPRRHLIRYHGVFAPAHPWRSRVGEALRADSQWLSWTPSPPQEAPPLVCVRKSRWLDWANLLKRVFAIEVLACVCGGRRRMLAVIHDRKVARRILEHLGLPAEPLPLGRVPPKPQSELWPTGPPADEHCQAPAPEDFDQRWAESEGQ